MKKALTLAEIMIVLVVIGIFSAVLLPIARNATPDNDLAKYKKNSSALLLAIKELVHSDEFYADGDLGLKADNTSVDDPKYFCKTLAGVLTTKTVNCSSDNLGYNSSAAINLTDIGVDVINGDSVSDYVDCVCKANTSSGAEITLVDNTIIYSINPYYHFGSLTESGSNPEGRLFNLCSSSRRYKILCLDIDGIGAGEDPFGYALRVDGAVIPGSRALAWNKKGIYQNDEEIAISSINSCTSTALSVIPESGICGGPAPKTCPEKTFEIEFSGVKYCIMKYNLGDNGFNATADTKFLTADRGNSSCNSSEKCCWLGNTHGNCYNINGDYSGCTRTVCNYNAALAGCSNLNYEGLTWRLLTSEEIAILSDKMQEVSAGQGNNGLMFCDFASYPNASEVCNNGSYCYNGNGAFYSCEAYCIWADGNYKFCQNLETFMAGSNLGYPASVRCIAELK
ncbi:MAG: type II secretion system protein [Candidatus Gastranaerophilales bacterium]|nr:type II secretion system protein [Candidatus Gastranaerophilales bacterium]